MLRFSDQCIFLANYIGQGPSNMCVNFGKNRLTIDDFRSRFPFFINQPYHIDNIQNSENCQMTLTFDLYLTLTLSLTLTI